MTLYDDAYTGLRWRYGLEHRPISQYLIGRDGGGDIPHPILFSHRPSRDRRCPHGEADWPCELTEAQCRHHGLVLISGPALISPAAYDRHLASGGSEPD